MLKTTFLAAANGNAMVKNLKTGESYPNVTNVNSFDAFAANLDELYYLLKMHADEGNCLLKGQLDRPLVNESRAGHVESKFTNLVVLDIDSDSLPFKSRDTMLKSFGIEDTDYIFQHSSKATMDEALRGHYFFMLEKAISTHDIKSWVKGLNFEVLYNSLELSKSKTSIKWPLDITVNDNAKIIYLAPPIQDVDPITERFIMCRRGAKSLAPVPTKKAYDIPAIINELRSNTGLLEQSAPTNGIIDINPDEVKITDMKIGDKYVYINLNGGDSWAYYFNPESPEIVYNFKDEPNFRLKDLDPSLHSRYHQEQPSGGAEVTISDDGTICHSKAIAFRDATFDKYWGVKYDPDSLDVTYRHMISSKDRVNDFLITNGEEKLKHIPDWDIQFHPPSAEQIRPSEKWCNLFTPTKYLKSTDTSTEIPPTFKRLIEHICVDKETYNYFINWMAFIVQTRQKTGTAWLFHGTTGTGKGSLFKRFLLPVFGHEHAFMATTKIVTEEKNQFMERNIICVADEFCIKEDRASEQMLATLRTYITEENVTIRAMRANGVMRPSYANFLFFSNSFIPMRLESDDRRMNIAPRQNAPLKDANSDDFHKALDQEVWQLVNYLRQVKYNRDQAVAPIMNEARDLIIRNSKTSHEEFWDAVNKGDIDFFTALFIDNPDPIHFLAYNAYYDAVLKWINSNGEPHLTTKEELLKVYTWVTNTFPAPGLQKFNKMCQLNGVEFKRLHYDDGKSAGKAYPRRHCIERTWSGDTEDLIENEAHPDLNNVVDIQRK